MLLAFFSTFEVSLQYQNIIVIELFWNNIPLNKIIRFDVWSLVINNITTIFMTIILTIIEYWRFFNCICLAITVVLSVLFVWFSVVLVIVHAVFLSGLNTSFYYRVLIHACLLTAFGYRTLVYLVNLQVIYFASCQ